MAVLGDEEHAQIGAQEEDDQRHERSGGEQALRHRDAADDGDRLAPCATGPQREAEL